MRYLFLCPEVSAASGGVAVIYACVETLRQAGHDAAVVHARADYRYSNTPFTPPILVSSELGWTYVRKVGRRRKLHAIKGLLQSKVNATQAEPVALRANDIIVVPEFMIATAAETFPNHQKIVFSQNPFSYINAFQKTIRQGLDPEKGVFCNLGMSDACMNAFSLMSLHPQLPIQVSPDLNLFNFGFHKKRKISYMPRKRKGDADFLHTALERRGLVKDFELFRLENLSQAETAQHLHDSLIFVSLMKEESLGFPGIEAMASGCVVVGFTGLGADEYFSPETGVPVREGDIIGLVLIVEKIAAEYRAGPTRLDALRHHASDVVRARYNPQAFYDTLLTAWSHIDQMARESTSGLELSPGSVR